MLDAASAGTVKYKKKEEKIYHQNFVISHNVRVDE